MKNFLLTFAIVIVVTIGMALVSCNPNSGNDNPPTPEKTYTIETFADALKANVPQKVTTIVNYTTDEETLNGRYVSIYADEYIQFVYEYDRYATVEEEAESRIVKSAGTAYYKDGLVAVTEGDEEPSEWAAVPASGIQANFDLPAGKDYVTLSEDHLVATFALPAESAAKVLGIDLKAKGNVSLTVTMNNEFLNNVKISYTTAQDAGVLINSSFTYGASTEELTEEKAIAKISALLRTVNPTKIVTETTQQIGTIVLESETTLTVGSVDGKVAATYVKVADELAGLASAESIVTTTTTYDYIEGIGTRVNGGAWNTGIASFIPAKGFLALNLKADLLEDVEFESGDLSFLVEADNVEDVLGSLLGEDDELDCDIYVTISTAGGSITGITLEYTVECYDPDAINQNDVDVYVETAYYYDLEPITID